MKIFSLALGTLALAGSLGAKPPAGRSTVPGKYPPIIQITPADPAAPEPAGGIYHTTIGGRELQFLQSARRSAAELLALAEVANAQTASEQIKSVAEMLGSMQATERGKLEEMAAARKLRAESAASGGIKKELGALSGARFEKAWVERLIGAAGASVESYAIGAKSTDAEVKAFAEKMLPVADARLQMANRLGGRSVNAPAPAPAPVEARPPVVAPSAGSPTATSPAPIAPPVVSPPAK